MLNQVKLLLGITDNSKDSLLQLLIEMATDDIVALTHRENIAGILNSVIIHAVLHNYNLLSVEGLSAESYSGASFTYNSDYPETLMRKIRALRKAVIL